MALKKALDFIELVMEDEKFRELCNSGLPREELLEILGFVQPEFDDAIDMNLVKCQNYEEAERYQELKTWFLML
jgi:hypothetical protein